MKAEEIVAVLAKELGIQDVNGINKSLKSKEQLDTKYKISGASLGTRGYTVAVKNISAEGVKVFDINKVILIRFSDIEGFEKAGPKKKRFVPPKKAAGKVSKKKKKKFVKFVHGDEDEEDEFDDVVPEPKREKRTSFIPVKK